MNRIKSEQMTTKSLRKKVHKCFQDLWEIMFRHNEDFCLECGSKDVTQYIERVCIYYKGEHVGFKDWNFSPYQAVECNACGWDNF